MANIIPDVNDVNEGIYRKFSLRMQTESIRIQHPHHIYGKIRRKRIHTSTNGSELVGFGV